MKKETTIIIQTTLREKRWALYREGKLVRARVMQPDGQSQTGNLYTGIVETVKPSMNACFVKYEDGSGKNAFLQARDIPGGDKTTSISSLVHQGQKILIQIKKDAAGSKGAVATANIEWRSPAVVYFPYGRIVTISKKIKDEQKRAQLRKWAESDKTEKEGFLFRTEAAELSLEELSSFVESARKEAREWERAVKYGKVPSLLTGNVFEDELRELLFKEKSGTVLVDGQEAAQWVSSFAAGEQWSVRLTNVEDVIDGTEFPAFQRKLWLKDGASIVIDQTEAMIVIDVNSSHQTKTRTEKQAVLQINCAAAREIGKQAVLRDLSGIILIDFINMSAEEDRRTVEKELLRAFQQDDRQVMFTGFTSLGIYQLTRKKTTASLQGVMTMPCPVCSGSGVVDTAETLAFRLERELHREHRSIDTGVTVEATQEVIDCFTGEQGSFGKLIEQSLGLKIEWQPVEHSHPFYAIRRRF